ncbi:helix-turn-helix domain-containing protein [Paenibacillus sp. FSL L8-0709]|uniref:helix-turn-helix domain-containing protein n=1 Tax=Paenibacillus sp. FSL L8-0709 TaxID=2975312 RepID=UPI0030FBFD89
MIGDILKKTRDIYGYKAKEMSVKLDISPSYLSEIENNKKKPSLDLLEKYAETFDMKVSTLILLSEDHDDAIKTNKPQEFIKKMMIKLIDVMSKDEVKSNGTNSGEV